MGSFFTIEVVSRKIVTMRLGFALVAVMAAMLVAACGDDGSMLPVGGGGNDGGFGFPDSTHVDSTVDDGQQQGDSGTPTPIDAALIMGRVCLANDPRNLDVCADTGAGGLTVRLGSETTTTGADGTFTIKAASGTWRVTGANIVTSISVLSDYEIPAILRTTYDAMRVASLDPDMIDPGRGSVMVKVIRNGVGTNLSATATSAPTASYFPRYDSDASQTLWALDMTHAGGTIWIPGIVVGSAAITVSRPNSQPIMVAGLPIVDDAITFTTVIFP
jgi:hypothetical protein